MGLRLKYFAGEAVVNLKRNLFMTVAAISTVAVSLFLLGGVIVLGHIVNNVVGKWEGKVEINVFLRDDISPTQQATLQDSIKGMPEVQDVFYDSKQQAYDEYKQMFAGSPTLTDDQRTDDCRHGSPRGGRRIEAEPARLHQLRCPAVAPTPCGEAAPRSREAILPASERRRVGAHVLDEQQLPLRA